MILNKNGYNIETSYPVSVVYWFSNNSDKIVSVTTVNQTMFGEFFFPLRVNCVQLFANPWENKLMVHEVSQFIYFLPCLPRGFYIPAQGNLQQKLKVIIKQRKWQRYCWLAEEPDISKQYHCPKDGPEHLMGPCMCRMLD